MEEALNARLFVAHNKVYYPDYIYNRHPGGPKCLDRCRGTECSRDYDMHGPIGRGLWAKAQVGVIAEPSIKERFLALVMRGPLRP